MVELIDGQNESFQTTLTEECKRKKVASSNCNLTKKKSRSIDMKLVNEARKLLSKEYELNSELYSPKYYEELMDEESAHTCWRFIKDNKYSIENSVNAMKRTLIFRLENDVDDEFIHKKLIKEFWHWAPINITGKDNEGREVAFIIGRDYRAADQYLKKYVRRYIIWLFATWDRQNRYNQDQVNVVFDVQSAGIRCMDVDFMIWLVGLVDHFPLRFYRINAIGINFIIRPFVRLIISFLPEKLSSRVYCGTLEDLILPNITPENIPDRSGGCADNSFRLAPPDTTWLEDSKEYQDEKFMKSLEYSLLFAIPQERRDKFKQMQIEYERNLNKNSN